MVNNFPDALMKRYFHTHGERKEFVRAVHFPNDGKGKDTIDKIKMIEGEALEEEDCRWREERKSESNRLVDYKVILSPDAQEDYERYAFAGDHSLIERIDCLKTLLSKDPYGRSDKD